MVFSDLYEESPCCTEAYCPFYITAVAVWNCIKSTAAFQQSAVLWTIRPRQTLTSLYQPTGLSGTMSVFYPFAFSDHMCMSHLERKHQAYRTSGRVRQERHLSVTARVDSEMLHYRKAIKFSMIDTSFQSSNFLLKVKILCLARNPQMPLLRLTSFILESMRPIHWGCQSKCLLTEGAISQDVQVPTPHRKVTGASEG